jgi:hypothetical protein
MPFAEASEKARALGLKSRDEWQKWWAENVNRSKGFPFEPEVHYERFERGQWKGHSHWLGCDYVYPNTGDAGDDATSGGSATVTSGAASAVDLAKSIDAGSGQQTSGGSTTGCAPTARTSASGGKSRTSLAAEQPSPERPESPDTPALGRLRKRLREGGARHMSMVGARNEMEAANQCRSMTDRKAAAPAKFYRPDIGRAQLYKAHNPVKLICIGPQLDGRCVDAAMQFIAGAQIIKPMHYEIMSNPNFDVLRANIKKAYFLKNIAKNLSPVNLFMLPPGVYIFLTYYVPDTTHSHVKLLHHAGFNGFKRVLHAGHGDASFLDDRDCSIKKKAAKVFADLRLRDVKEVCQLMVTC